MNNKEKLLSAIMIFLRVTYNCYTGTTYAQDRLAFQSDIAICTKWILDVESNTDIHQIVSEILDNSTAKHIVDYYKQGKFGEEQATAFTILKRTVEQPMC